VKQGQGEGDSLQGGVCAASSEEPKGLSLYKGRFYIFMPKKSLSFRIRGLQALQRQRTLSGCSETRHSAYSAHSTLEIARMSIQHCMAALLLLFLENKGV